MEEETSSTPTENKLITNFSNLDKLKSNPNEFFRYLVAIHTLENYSTNFLNDCKKIEKDFKSIDEKYLKKMNYDYKSRMERLKASVELNQNFINKLIKIYKPPKEYYNGININHLQQASKADIVHFFFDVFTSITREWTKEHEKEREESFGTIINEVKKYFEINSNKKEKYKFLVPGDALCRLGYELASLGYDVESNDYCFYCGIIVDFLFNHCKKNECMFLPFIRTFSNFFSEDAVFKEFTFPDVDIDLKNKGQLKLTIGDFTFAYLKYKNYFDCVVTSFFIDTARNVLGYIEIIHNILKEGGVWINFGTLSYMWSNYDYELSIELPYDKLKETIVNFGFEFVNDEIKKKVVYGKMDDFMKNSYFDCVFFTVKKIK